MQNHQLTSYFKNWRILEQMVYWAIWLIIIFLPLLFWDYGDIHERKRIIWGWMRVFPFLVIFLIHNTLLLPYVLNRKLWTSYLLLALLLILIINFLFVYIPAFHDFLRNIFIGEESIGRGYKGRGPSRIHRKMPAPEFLLFIYNVFISILLAAFNATLNFTTRWLKKEQEQKEIARESMQSQLNALQQQVSPHFFMNTLNNIHALIDYNKDSAKESVLRLSELMRYLLYDSSRESTLLQKEIDFLNSYIDLMRLRINDSVNISTEFPKDEGAIMLPPFLFLPFVENAFKYGILARDESKISIRIEVVESILHFNCLNLKTGEKAKNGEHSGLGISNTRKRLDLLYNKNYTLNIFDRKNDFEVDLVIPIS